MPEVAATPDTAQVQNPETGEIVDIQNTPESLAGAQAQGYKVYNTSTNLDISSLKEEAAHPETYLAGLDQQNAEDSGQSKTVKAGDYSVTTAIPAKPAEPTIIPSPSDIDITPDNHIRVINPETQEITNIQNSPESITGAKQQGYQLVSEFKSDVEGQVADQAKVDVWKQRLNDSGVGGAIVAAKSFGAGASSEDLTNHIYDYVIKQIPNLGGGRFHMTPEDTPFVSQALRQLTQQHSDIDIGARGAGLIASVLTGGEAGSVAGKAAVGAVGLEGATSLGGKVAASALKNVVENTVIMAPNIAEDLVNKDPGSAAETVAMGAALGGLFDLAGAGVKAGIKKFVNEKELQEGATLGFVNALGAAPHEVVQSLRKEGFTGPEDLALKVLKFKDPEELMKMSNAEKGDFFLHLGKEGGKELDAIDKELDNFKQPAYHDLKTSSGLPSSAFDVNFGKYTIDGNSIIDKIKTLAEETTGSAEHNIVRQSIKDVAEKMSKTEALGIDKLTFEDTHKLQSLFARRAAGATVGTPEKYFQTAIADILRTERMDSIKRILKDFPDSKLEQRLRDANDKYRVSKVFVGEDLKARADITALLDFSRIAHTGIGSTLGHTIVGGLIGGAVGSIYKDTTGSNMPSGVSTLSGIAAGAIGGRYLRHYMGEKGLLKLNAAILKQGNSELSKSLIVAGQQSLAEKLKAVAPVLSKIGVKAYDVHKELGKEKPSPIKDFLGEEANGLSKQQQVERVVKKFSSMTDDQQWTNHKTDILSQFGSFPKLLPELSQRLDAQKSILQNAIPQRQPPKPFQKQSKQEYTKTEINNMEDVMRLAQDPFELLHELKEGSLTPQKVAVVAAIFPNVLQQIKQEMFRSSKDLPYQHRLFLSVLMQENIDTSQDHTPDLQKAYANVNVPPAGPAKKPGNKGSASYATTYQQSVGNYLK